ncbi:EAL domain-containing protein [Sulfurovum sp.]|uniref:EAL domain-containing protein n=1 Tax=Sulfurovum sp. TaxID=1969726 RepID=UPI0025EA38BD|nr:GGDEF domain-containing protein [Sulfurovum sp.]
MLLSELEERERRFKLALRAGIPLLVLIFLVLYAVFFQDEELSLTLTNKFLIAGIVFITIYFIYFLIELSVQETLIDQTTQGFNQKAFIHKLERYRPTSLVLLTIENLSTLNEHYSIEQIDHLLYTMVHKLNHIFKQHGLDHVFIGRLYGAEFVIALNNNSEKIQSIMEQFIQENKTIHDIEVDYKFAIATHTGGDFKKLIVQLKDIIAAQRKEISEPKESNVIKNTEEISQIETNIITAIEEEKLLLSFRPLLNTRSDQIDIYEISVKLKSDTTGDILPRVYLPVVNRLGLGRDYDFILFKHVVDLLPLVDETIAFSFNLSPFSLRDKTFQNKFFTYLKEKHVDPSRLIIELYERKTHHNLSGYLKTLNTFRSKGVRIAIDNFGSSNASMEYMKHFKFDLIQFDRDYVTKLDDVNTYAMLTSLVKMSKDLHITTVAKWVDKESQKNRLKALGIDYLQGFGIAKSITEKTLIDRYN